MVHTLFESILGNKILEERLQKAAGRRHTKSKHGSRSQGTKETPVSEPASDSQKRKFDEMEMDYSNGPPAPQMSYERSRPQSPAVSPSREAPQGSSASGQQQGPQITAGSPTIRQGNDAFMGTSRANTRPTTPFNHFSYPGTPPDIFLHTRHSPKMSDDLWQNYQPEQLFPPETNALFPINTQSPNQPMVDPALRNGGPQQTPNQQGQQFAPQQQGLPTPTHMHPNQQMPGPDGQQPGMPMAGYHQDQAAWQQVQMQSAQNQQRQDDQWSNSSSAGGPIVPTTLNVGDWFDFFGIPNGSDLSGLNGGSGFG